MTPPLTPADRRMTVFVKALAIMGVLLTLFLGWFAYIVINAPEGVDVCKRDFAANGNRLPLKYVPYLILGGWNGDIAESCEHWSE